MTDSKIEQYLVNLMITYQKIDSNIWLLDDEDHSLQGVAIMQAEPFVIFRAEVMDVPKENIFELYKTLLELNATDVIHGAYALEKTKIVLLDNLEYDTMNYENFRATLDSFSFALSQDYPILSKFRDKPTSKKAAGK